VLLLRVKGELRRDGDGSEFFCGCGGILFRGRAFHDMVCASLMIGGGDDPGRISIAMKVTQKILGGYSKRNV